MNAVNENIQTLVGSEYKYGFVTDLETDAAPRGLNEDVIRLISTKKNEPEWLLEWRLKAYRRWLTMPEPGWANVVYPPIDYLSFRRFLIAANYCRHYSYSDFFQ